MDLEDKLMQTEAHAVQEMCVLKVVRCSLCNLWTACLPLFTSGERKADMDGAFSPFSAFIFFSVFLQVFMRI